MDMIPSCRIRKLLVYSMAFGNFGSRQGCVVEFDVDTLLMFILCVYEVHHTRTQFSMLFQGTRSDRMMEFPSL